MTSLALTGTSPASLKVDAVVVGLVQGPRGPQLAAGAESLVEAMGKGLLAALVGLGATGKAEQVVRLATLGATGPKVVAAVGLGPVGRGPVDAEALRRAAGAAVRTLAGSAKVALALPTQDDPALVAAAGEGALLGAYRFDRYRTTDERPPVVAELQLCAGSTRDAALKAAVVRAQVVADAVALARDLVNTPPSDLRPADLADLARREAQAAGLEVEVLDEKALKKQGFGGILGVGAGSSAPPRLVHLSHHGGGRKVALIGKGITFDSGGLSLKPAASMEEMKSDMGGAAAVIATCLAAARLGLAVELEAWVPMAENMPSGTATRPSDVLTMHSGLTVEVNNTDAEGRLILADALSRAGQDEPELMLDVATLTGAQLVALGARTTAVMGEDALREEVLAAAARAGEPSWGMPLPADLRKGLDSEVADMVNTGPREGGMLTAGLFLKEFVPEGVRWAHLDIAGPAFNSGQAYGYTEHGGTGAAVRTFVALLEDVAAARTQD